MPVSLSYHASGFKVQDVASSAGLGWTLNAGGVITRIVRGLPDESTYGYRGTHALMQNYVSGNQTTIESIAGGVDGEPDLYFFNFLGHTGKFVVDASSTVIQMPKTALLISPPPTLSSNKWIITDEKGVVYTFGGTADSQETTTATSTSQYYSSWYLNSIFYPNTNETVTLTYVSGGSMSYSYYNWNSNWVIGSVDAGGNFSCSASYDPNSGTPVLSSFSVTHPQPLSLSSIRSSVGTINFVYSGYPRTDVGNGLILDHLVLSDYSSNAVQTRNFRYSYFPSGRLRFDGVDNPGYPAAASIPVYQFAYNATTLPARNSYAFDHWGFYNNNSYPSPCTAVAETRCGFSIQAQINSGSN